MIPNRKKKQTNKKLKHRQPVRIILHVSTQSITTLCLNRFARLHIIRHSLTHFCLPVPQGQIFKIHHMFVGVVNVVDFLLVSLFVF